MKGKNRQAQARRSPTNRSDGSDKDTAVMTQRQLLYIAIGIVAAASTALALYVFPMPGKAGAAGFPADGAWIHLTFAQNLREFGSYSYFQDLMVTSGSTSPLYVFLLTLAGMLPLGDIEAVFLIGAAAFAGAAVFMFLLANRMFPAERWVAVSAALLFVLMPRMESAAVAGMGTMLYISLTLGALFFLVERRYTAFSAMAGAALWVRPDALIFILAVAVHYLYHRYAGSKRGKPGSTGSSMPWPGKTGLALYAFLLLGYAAFNLAMSGTIFPNSVAAKTAAVASMERPPFLPAVLAYFEAPQSAVLLPFAVLGAVLTIVSMARRERADSIPAMLIAVGTIAAYGFLLPILPEDGRYLAPVYPFYIILSLWGIRDASGRLRSFIAPKPAARIGTIAILTVSGVALISGVSRWTDLRNEYFKSVRYVLERHVSGARWAAENTSAETVIATHLPGVFGYYSDRRVLDLSGIVSPEIIAGIGNPAAMEASMKVAKVGYIATLRERYEVVNSNPVFTSDPKIPEVMEVFKYEAGRTHIMPSFASTLNYRAAMLMSRKLNTEALSELRRSHALDPSSARTNTLIGICYLELGDTAQARTFLEAALDLQTDYFPAMVPFGAILSGEKEHYAAIRVLNRAVASMPSSVNAQQALQKAQDAYLDDSLEAMGFRRMRLLSR